MTNSLIEKNFAYALNYITSMAREPLRCMRHMGLESPSAVAMQGAPSGKGRRLFYLTGGENVRPIYNNPHTYFTSNVPLRAPGGGAQSRLRRGLIGAQGEEHKHYRAAFTAHAGRAMMTEFASDVATHASRWLEAIPVGTPVDLVTQISDLVRYYSVAMMFKDDDPEAAINIGRKITAWIELGYNAKNVLFPVNIPGSPYAQYRKISEELELDLIKWADARRGLSAKRDILSMFVNGPDESGQPLSDDRLAGHIATIYAAAFTSSVSALIWAVFLLAQHPTIAHDLCDEITGAGIDPATDGMRLLELPLLDRVLKESMRLFTPVPYQVRRVTADTRANDISYAHRDIIVIGAWATNRLRSVYRDADSFQPERWLTNDANNYDYLVFSAGPRRCVGYALAQIMVKITLATILMRRHPTLIAGQRIDTKVAVTLRTKQPIMALFNDATRHFERQPVEGSAANLYRVTETA
ncbi:MAG: cytochrome P450 [Xanthobacteraceae bacterium]|nr:cytochrome P450 [Xanthobacteraceae bacterium]